MIVTRSSFGIHIFNEQGEYLLTFGNNEWKSEILNYIQNQKEETVTTDDKAIFETIKRKASLSSCRFDSQNQVLSDFREARYAILHESSVIADYEEYKARILETAIAETSEKLREKANGRESLIIQTIIALEELSKAEASIFNRLVEIYDIHFPELGKIVYNQNLYAKIVGDGLTRSEMTLEALKGLGVNEATCKKILERVEGSVGTELVKQDLPILKKFAEIFATLVRQKVDIQKWITVAMSEFAPNVTAVAGATVGAKLIAKAGGLEKLAMKPSGKVQTFGAEKAMYSALKSGGATPKHGIIFQIPEITASPFWIRGKLARAFASKISIASRLDLYNGKFLGEEYRAKLRTLTETLRKKHPKPPQRKSKTQKDRIKNKYSKRQKNKDKSRDYRKQSPKNKQKKAERPRGEQKW